MPTDDYVKREDIFPAVTEIAKEIVFGDQDDDKVVDIINSIPAADVEQKRGTGWWIPGDYVAIEHGECVTYPGEGITCSRCRFGFKKRFLWSREYCPNCGSRMLQEPPKEEEDGEVH